MSDGVKLLMQMVVSLTLLIAGLWIVLKNVGGADTQKAAFGWIGVVAGFWLR